MSDIPVNPIGPVDPIPTGGEGIAERYVEKELVESRASLRRTQIIGVVLSLFVIGYMGYLTSGFRANLEPKGAATVATGIASQRLDDLEPQFASYIHEQVPEMIRKAPDELISRLPEYRKTVEERVDTALRQQAEQGATQLNKQLDDFLTAHKDEVGELLKNGQDPAYLEKFGGELEQSFQSFLNDQKIGDETIQQKLTSTLTALKQVSSRTAKLAANKGLTPSEKNARKAVAMLMRRIDAAKTAEPDAIKPIDPDALKNGANQAMDNLKGAVDQAKAHVEANMPEGVTSSATSPEPAGATPSGGKTKPATPSHAMAAPTGAPAPHKSEPSVKKP